MRVPVRTWIFLLVWLVSGLGAAVEPDRSGKVNDYDQWRQALGSDLATEAGQVVALPGYEVELLRSAAADEGSWVALAFDPQGRLTVAREDKGLLRFTLGPNSKSIKKAETIDDTLLECRGLLYAHGSLYANANNSHGLFRLTDTNGDDRFDEIKLLRETSGGVGHGRNNLTLGPDGKIYLIHGNDTQLPTDFLVGDSPYRNYAEDRLLPCEWNKQLFNYGVQPPAGHVVRTDAEGETWELVAGGMRNPFGIDFNADGELFTFDADMEWDEGLPWYRPCRVNHLVSGGEYGWRQGTGKWAAWYPDSLPSTLDIGLASPTSVQFGTQSNFPPAAQRALYICDWAYGRILAVHLQPQGASYTAQAETFVRGRPLNVTGLTFGPDGAMYFTTGGRKTQAGLYRVRYVGPPEPDDSPSEAELQAAAAARSLRHKLESFHGHADPAALMLLWPQLGSSDAWLRHAARVALESQPVAKWQARALAEPNAATAVTALLALARVGDSTTQAKLLERLASFSWNEQTADVQLALVRAVQLSLLRQGRPDASAIATLSEVWNARYPNGDTRVNQLLCELLVSLESSQVVEKTLPLIASAKTQEEKIRYLYSLRNVRTPWKPHERQLYFRWLGESHAFHGARYVPTCMALIEADALATLSEKEKEIYRPLLEPPVEETSLATTSLERPFVREWKVDALVGSLEEVGRNRDLARGKAVFAAAACIKCHRFAGQGQLVGPDLSGVARRFGRRDVLESILFPSKAIDDKYRNVMLATDDGRVLIGTLLSDDGETVRLTTDPTQPSKTVALKKSSIESQQFSLTSPMPVGTLNTLTKEEILDLLAYLESLSGTKAPTKTDLGSAAAARLP
jgi:putative heme-binding domain-containing protein